MATLLHCYVIHCYTLLCSSHHGCPDSIQVVKSSTEPGLVTNLTVQETTFNNCGVPGLTKLGGAVFIDNSSPRSNVLIINSTFTNCRAAHGAAVFSMGGEKFTKYEIVGARSLWGSKTLSKLTAVELYNVIAEKNAASKNGVFYMTSTFVDVKNR